MKSIFTLTFIVSIIFPATWVIQNKQKATSQNSSEQTQKKSSVDFEKFASLIKQADKIVVYDFVMESEKILFTSSDPKDIADFQEALTIVTSDEWFRCACMSSPTVRLYRGNKVLDTITYFSPQTIRSSIWESDARLGDSEKWLRWFDDRKITWPRREYEADLARAKEYEIKEAKWQNAMPNSIRPLWGSLTNSPFLTGILGPDLAPVKKAVAKEFPNTSQRILVLLTWFGSGAGSWSGYPAYEQIAEKLLLDYPLTDLVAAISSTTLTEVQLEGAARLLASWDFSQNRPKDLKHIPADLKKLLLAHSLKSNDEDKRERAKAAFEK